MDVDVIIVGGGLNGCTLALALDTIGVSVTVIDALAKDNMVVADFDGRCYAVAAANARMLRTLGLWDTLHDAAEPMWEIKVTDGRAGEGPAPHMMHFDHAGIGDGPLGYIVQDRHLRVALLEAVERSKITHITETKVVSQSIQSQAATVTLDTGKKLSAQILVGADGRGSGTATRAGIQRLNWGYDQTSLVCSIDHERPHNGVAHQFFMPSGPLAILPLPGNRSSIVWTETKTQAAKINALPDEDYLKVLQPRFGDFLGNIALTGPRFTYPLGLILAHQMTTHRVALVGDAAHGVHPIAGQGLNAGLKDVAALAECLANTKRLGQDLNTALSTYAQWRRFDNATLAMATDGFNRLFSNDNPLIRGLRTAGMGLINALPKAKSGFMKEASAQSGELPRLLQGKSL